MFESIHLVLTKDPISPVHSPRSGWIEGAVGPPSLCHLSAVYVQIERFYSQGRNKATATGFVGTRVEQMTAEELIEPERQRVGCFWTRAFSIILLRCTLDLCYTSERG